MVSVRGDRRLARKRSSADERMTRRRRSGYRAAACRGTGAHDRGGCRSLVAARAWHPSSAWGRRCRRCAESPCSSTRLGCDVLLATPPRAAGDADSAALRAPTARAGGWRRPAATRTSVALRRRRPTAPAARTASRALRSGFCVRAICCSRIACRAGTVAHRQLLRERDVVGLGQRQARDLLVLPPDARQPRERRPASARCRAAPRTTRLQARRRRARRARRAAPARVRGATRASAPAGVESPVGLAAA